MNVTLKTVIPDSSDRSHWISNSDFSFPVNAHSMSHIQRLIEYKSQMPRKNYTYNGIKNFTVPTRRAFFLTEYSRLYGMIFPPGTLCFRPFGDNLYCVIPADFGDLYARKKSLCTFHYNRNKIWEYESPCYNKDIEQSLRNVLIAMGKGDEDSHRYPEREIISAFNNRWETGRVHSMEYKITYSIKGNQKYAYVMATSLVEAERMAKARYPRVEQVKKVAG